MDFEDILLEEKEGVITLTLNRPERLNSCTTRMYRELSNIMNQIKRSSEVKVVILTGAGKGFCAGELGEYLRSCNRAEAAIHECNGLERKADLTGWAVVNSVKKLDVAVR